MLSWLLQYVAMGQIRLLSYTSFTCQATVRQNETARSDVIVPFGLHVWSHSHEADASVNIHCAA